MEVRLIKCTGGSKLKWIFWLCTFIFCFGFSVEANETNVAYYQELIEEADSVRSSKRTKFNEIVAELNMEFDALTPIQKWHVVYFRGYQKVIAGELQQAFSLLDSVINQNDALVLRHRAIITKMTAYTTADNYHEGFIVLNQMLPMLDEMADRDTFHRALFVVSQFYNVLGQYELSKKYVDQLLASFPTDKHRCVASMLKFEASFRLNQLTEYDIKNSQVEICERVEEFIASGAIYAFMVQWYLQTNRPHDALSLLNKHRGAIEGTQYYLIVATWKALIAQTYFQLGELAQAEQYAKAVVDSMKPNNKLEGYTESAFMLYELNKARGDFENALMYHEFYQTSKFLLVEDSKKRNVSYQVAQKDNQEKAHEILMLGEKNKRLNVEKELFQQRNKSRQLQVVLLSIIVIALLTLAIRSYLAQHRLKNIADHDELTGIFNRRCFRELADSALNYCTKTRQPVSLLMFDIDKFKDINDKYGHDVGDWALVKVVETCNGLRRKNDIIGRFGGEEFTILLPGCKLDKAKELAEVYRQAIANISTKETGHDFDISASFGVFSSWHAEFNLNDIVKAADQAMYHSKRTGRNRVSVYGHDTKDKVDLAANGHYVT